MRLRYGEINTCTILQDYEIAVSKDTYDQEEIIREKYQPMKADCKLSGSGYLVTLTEETLSQIAIEEIMSEASEDGDCRDLVPM